MDENKGKRIRLQLQKRDKEILEQFKKDLSIDSKLIEDKRQGKEAYSVEFSDAQIFNDLQKFGIIPQKTYKTQHLLTDNIPKEFIPAYLLGLYDGDGCLTCSSDYSKDVSFGFTTHFESVAEDFQTLINELIQKNTRNKISKTNACHINWRGALQVEKILDILYSSCPIHLERKYNKYLELKRHIKLRYSQVHVEKHDVK